MSTGVWQDSNGDYWYGTEEYDSVEKRLAAALEREKKLRRAIVLHLDCGDLNDTGPLSCYFGTKVRCRALTLCEALLGEGE